MFCLQNHRDKHTKLDSSFVFSQSLCDRQMIFKSNLQALECACFESWLPERENFLEELTNEETHFVGKEKPIFSGDHLKSSY